MEATTARRVLGLISLTAAAAFGLIGIVFSLQDSHGLGKIAGFLCLAFVGVGIIQTRFDAGEFGALIWPWLTPILRWLTALICIGLSIACGIVAALGAIVTLEGALYDPLRDIVIPVMRSDARLLSAIGVGIALSFSAAFLHFALKIIRGRGLGEESQIAEISP